MCLALGFLFGLPGLRAKLISWNRLCSVCVCTFVPHFLDEVLLSFFCLTKFKRFLLRLSFGRNWSLHSSIFSLRLATGEIQEIYHA